MAVYHSKAKLFCATQALTETYTQRKIKRKNKSLKHNNPKQVPNSSYMPIHQKTN